MINNNMSKRLLTLAKLAKNHDLALDVGCDHAKLSIYLIENNYCKRVIASDLREKPLKRAIEEVQKRGLEDKISCVLSCGIEHLDEVADIVIIAGMGGALISHIIDNEKIKYVKKLLIQANSDHYLLRKTITKLGFFIENEKVIEEENVFYTFIVAKRGEEVLNETELEYGPVNIKNKDSDFINFIKKQNLYYQDLLTKIPKDSEKYQDIVTKINQTNEIINK